MGDIEVSKLLYELGKKCADKASIISRFSGLPDDSKERVSGKVKPTDWWVCFKPIHDPTVLGPFGTRAEAERAEKKYLLAQL